MAWVTIALVIISIAISIVSALLAPKPKKTKPAEVQDLENPTAEAGRPIPVVFGKVIVKGLNVLWFGEKNTYTYKVKA